MLKNRIIPIQLLLDGRLVKTKKFSSFRDVGDPVASSRVYNSQYADELVFLNIARENRTIEPLLSLLDRVSEVCFMPLSLGGGIKNSKEAELLIRHGADKVVLNSVVYQKPEVVSGIANCLGSQAVVVSIDCKFNSDSNEYELYSNCGQKREPISLKKHISRSIELGAGELLVNSIDQDGMMTGYDTDLLKIASVCSSVPVIGCGGAGNYEHMKEGFLRGEVSALACGSLFNFSDSNPIRAKAFLSNYGLKFKSV